MKKKEVKIKPRNPLVVHVVQRSGGGSHKKSEKSLRTIGKVKFKKEDWSSQSFLGNGVLNGLS
ncbi:MAG TPA: hypothetical protein VM577_03490 [Anaerovoracaceae bacterium]|nr:hypothetical protein [Anaerovoracaceae bacterium]